MWFGQTMETNICGQDKQWKLISVARTNYEKGYLRQGQTTETMISAVSTDYENLYLRLGQTMEIDICGQDKQWKLISVARKNYGN